MPNQNGTIPSHIAIIPDGNRRWAKLHGVTLEASYSQGGDCFDNLLSKCMHLGIKNVSVYGFSNENVHRTAVNQFAHAIHRVICFATQIGFNVELIGDVSDVHFPESLKPDVCIQKTNSPFTLYMLANYSLEWDLRHAINKALTLPADILNHTNACDLLATHHVPAVDLLIRWGGNRRLSGFLPYQTNYANLYFLEKLWPEYTDDDIDHAIEWYRHQVNLHGL